MPRVRVRVTAMAGAASPRFDTVIGRVYTVERTDDLFAVPQVWTAFTNQIPGTGGSIAITDPLPGTNRSYRVRVGLD